jgi:hypothetical protein
MLEMFFLDVRDAEKACYTEGVLQFYLVRKGRKKYS